MPYLMVRHQVEDYDVWKDAFDADAEQRQKAGSNGGYVLQDLEDESMVTVMLEFDDDRLDDIKQFAQTEALKTRMEKAGVVGQPQIYVLNDAEEVSG